MLPIGDVVYRQATGFDAPAIAISRARDPGPEPRDARLAAYLEGTHHPTGALAPRVVYVAVVAGVVVGYAAGHLTQRWGCEGEVQHLWVMPERRRSGVGSGLLQCMRRWFADRGAGKACVNVAAANREAQAFFRHHGAGDLGPHWLVWANMRDAV